MEACSIKFGYIEEVEIGMYGVSFGLSLLSLLVNGFVLYLARRMGLKGQVFSEQVIIGVTLVDILNSITMIAGGFGRLVLGFPGTFRSLWFCRVIGGLEAQLPFYSLMLVCALAGERFYAARYGQNFNMHRKKACRVVICGIFSMALPAFSNIVANGFCPDPTYSFCWPQKTLAATIQNFLISLFIFQLIILLAVFYVCSGFSWLRDPFAPIDPTVRQNIMWSLSPRSTNQCSLFIFAYLTCFGPKIVTTVWFMSGNGASHPFLLYMIDPIAIQFIVLINPILLIWIAESFRLEAISVFTSLKPHAS